MKVIIRVYCSNLWI